MVDKIFLDTNILVYLFDKSERQKQTKIKTLVSEYFSQSKFFLSVQVINEFINVTTRKITFPIPVDKQKEIIELVSDLFLVTPLNLSTTLGALEVSRKYRLSYWDSLIISSALENKCNILYTEDMQNGFIIEDKLTIINPFQSSLLNFS